MLLIHKQVVIILEMASYNENLMFMFIMSRPHRAEALNDDARLTSV